MASTRFPKLRALSTPTLSRTQDNVAAALDPLARALANTPIMGASPPPWIRPTLLNGYAQAAAPRPVTAFHKNALGYVHGKFALVTAAGCAANTRAFTLNAGFRPAETLLFVASDSTGLFWEIIIDGAGAFIVRTATVAGDVVAGAFSFLAER